MAPPSKRKVTQLELQSSEHMHAEDSPMTSTPIQTFTQTDVLLTPSTRSAPYTGPQTRSMARSGFVGPSEVHSSKNSSRTLAARLQTSVKRPVQPLKLSKLEDAKNIDYVGGGDDGYGSKNTVGDHDEDHDEDSGDTMVTYKPLPSPQALNSLGKHLITGQLRMLSGQKGIGEEQDLSFDDGVTTPARKKARKDTPSKPLRRSPRFLKPLTEFHKYPYLPDELKIMIWEEAVEPRLLYICNRSSISHAGRPFGVQNKLPPWFLTCRISVEVALKRYQKRFELTPLPWGTLIRNTKQYVNLDLDIVIFEPCHNGCRGYHCARHQYSDEDRAAVRFLTVQTESPNLVAGAVPCWQSISRSWPSVETLYLTRVAVKGINRRDKAMLRISPNDREIGLQKLFEEWKKGMGKGLTLEKLEFVVVVDKETSSAESYKSVEDRKTGLLEDIILD
ncbi:hypothetical protein GGR53DRAFT_49092 [Hypoxylon sp. FL1150]|nr:hypothetical protein GGR53DRAFT_49092 [Hypoxylon sp. FL1150]